MSEHIVPLRIYVTIFLALLVGTAFTVWAGFRDFPGQLNVIIALTIAGNACRALLHARSLQLTTYLGGLYFCVILAGNSLRIDLQRLLDQKLVDN